MTKDDSSCQAEACSLQGCLQKNTYAPEKCDAQMMALYMCCSALYNNAKAGSSPKSTACPKPAVVERWLKRKGVQ